MNYGRVGEVIAAGIMALSVIAILVILTAAWIYDPGIQTALLTALVTAIAVMVGCFVIDDRRR